MDVTNAVSPRMRAHVATRLAEVAASEGVRVLYAAESGSRAWGFASPDSDYDVRFIYAHPRQWYLGLEKQRDVIERPLDAHLVDLAGWDVRKALRLLLKSNPALYEWLVSPIAYADDGAFAAAARELFVRHASPITVAHHYHSIARGQWRSEIADTETPKLKKYFYVVRPLLSLQWVIRNGTMPPMSIDALLERIEIPGDVRRIVGDLLAAKRETPELGRNRRIAELDRWALAELDALAPEKHQFLPQHTSSSRAEADQLFIATARL